MKDKAAWATTEKGEVFALNRAARRGAKKRGTKCTALPQVPLEKRGNKLFMGNREHVPTYREPKIKKPKKAKE